MKTLSRSSIRIHNMAENTLINRVDQSGIVTIDLEKYYPPFQVLSFDLNDFLFHGLILKEKDFRQALKEHNWQQYKDAVVCVYCSSDAIIPIWAYMLVSSYASPVATEVFSGTATDWLRHYYHTALQNLDLQPFKDKKIVIKGCSDKEVPASAYADITGRLMPVAQSIMYGEPCSTVPVFKKKAAIETDTPN